MIKRPTLHQTTLNDIKSLESLSFQQVKADGISFLMVFEQNLFLKQTAGDR